MLRLYEVLEEVESPINGKLQVVKTFEGVKILGGGISQSGWLVKKVWNAGLKRIKEEKPEISSVLILGLGGGSCAELVSHYWPQAKITGIEKDPTMISLGRRYLHLSGIPRLKIVEADVKDFLKEVKNKYDLVLVDIYIGGKIPEEFTREEFVKKVAGLVKSGGVVAFNHLYSQNEREDAKRLGQKLRKVFPVITEVRPEANIIFLCYKL